MDKIELIEEFDDFKPHLKYRRFSKIVFGIWGVTLVFLIISLFVGWRFIIGVFLLILIITSIFIKIMYDMLDVLHRWDDFDYTNLQKHSFIFTSSDGIEHYTYIYAYKGVDIFDEKNPKPTIIGIHGYGGHHRIMDRYCLPTIIEGGLEKSYILFVLDVRGHGKTGGDRNDFIQFRDAKEYIIKIKSLPIVDKKRIGIVGMSLGASKAAVYSYTDPEIKILVMLSGTFDMELTRNLMSTKFRTIFRMMGFPLWGGDDDDLFRLSGINNFNPDGVILKGDNKLTPNSERIFLAANLDDKMVHFKNTIYAIKKLNLPESNYRLYKNGKHIFVGNEWLLSAAIFNFIDKKL